MKNSKVLFQDFISTLTIQETPEEIKSIAYLVFERLFGLTITDVLAEKLVRFSSGTTSRLNEIAKRINAHEPVQYILGECFFYGRIFKLTPSVLIPRPETEELVRLVIDFVHSRKKADVRILDIGTGSGCIAATLALELPEAKVFATDVSAAALQTASANAQVLSADVQFLQHDILSEALPFSIDIIVSNPPYITWSERDTIAKNVTDYEPELALFVDSKDPLLFYKAIVTAAKKSLTTDGLLAVEINERFGAEMHQLFQNSGLDQVEVLQDILGKDRIVKGVLSS
jgi:release factor glutamine methyltransferase